MSLQSIPVFHPRPVPFGKLRQERPKRNKITNACVGYLTTGEYKYFSWLVGLLFKAKGNLFVAAPSENRFSRFSRQSLNAQTRAFIVAWLCEFLDKYSLDHLTRSEIQDLARLGEFQHLGRQCRFALIKTFRTSSDDALDQVAKQDDTTYWDNCYGLPAVVSLDSPIETDEYGGELSLADVVSCASNGASALGRTPSLEVEDLLLLINSREHEFRQLLSPDLYDALKCCAECFPEVRHLSKELGKRRGVSQRYARSLIAALRTALHSARMRQGALAYELYHLHEGQATRAAQICQELRAGLNAVFELYCLLSSSGQSVISFGSVATARKPGAE